MAVAPVYYRPKSFTLTDQYIKESVEAVATFNTRIRLERNARLPFIDSQTGLAQNSSTLWHPYLNRGQGSAPGQIYSYPSKRWKKKRRSFNLDYSVTKGDVETGASDMHQISAVENPAVADTPTVVENVESGSKDKWYEEVELLTEPLDAGEIDDRNTDSSDYEETYVKRRKKKKATPKRQSRKKNKEEPSEFDDKEKPYSCEVCGARYKTRPGLTYHLTHSHMSADEVDEDSASSQLSKAPTPTGSRESSRGTRSSSRNNNTSGNNSSNPNSNNSYCDFCLGDENENKKTGGKEELVSCGDCGRSGHPTCLQFTANMIISVKKYRWQCIECKSCGLCGTSDNDEQLLFCDDCDRGYHMYCLNPPLSEPPEGSWSCHLCIEEFYGGKKPPGML